MDVGKGRQTNLRAPALLILLPGLVHCRTSLVAMPGPVTFRIKRTVISFTASRGRALDQHRLQYAAITSGGGACDIAFPLRPEMRSAASVSEPVTRLPGQ